MQRARQATSNLISIRGVIGGFDPRRSRSLQTASPVGLLEDDEIRTAFGPVIVDRLYRSDAVVARFERACRRD
jgi:hypothetical protein